MIGKETFGLSKKDFSEKFSRIVEAHRVNSRLIGQPREFILRSCKLTQTWSKVASDPEVSVVVRNLSIAGGRKVKLVCLERGGTQQPVPKGKLLDSLYPPKKIKTSASPEEKHYNSVKGAMRQGVSNQIKAFRANCEFPVTCYLTGKTLRKGCKTDVDHVGWCFSEIADNFIRESGLLYTEISLVGPPTAKKFRDDALWKSWQDYHFEKARFSLVCASANRSKGAGDYCTPEELYGSFDRTSPEEVALDF